MFRATYKQVTKGVEYRWEYADYTGTPFFFIQKRYMRFLNKLKIAENTPPFDKLWDKLQEKTRYYEEVVYVDENKGYESFTYDDILMNYTILARKDGVKTAIQTAFYRFFKKNPGKFYISDKKEDIVLYLHNNDIIGGIMPFYIKEL